MFLAAANSLSSFDESRGTLNAWLLGIAHRWAARYWKHHSTGTRFLESLTEQQISSIFYSDADAGLNRGELSAAVRSVVSRMSEDAASLLVGYYLEENSTRQLSIEMGISEQAVRSRLSRARAQFREMFQVAHREFV